MRAPKSDSEVTRPDRSLTLALLANATFGGFCALAVPLGLSAAGRSKVDIASFFVFNAILAVVYNTFFMTQLRRIGYPRKVLVGSAAAVPVGVLLVHSAPTGHLLLFCGGALMMMVSTLVPQLFGILFTTIVTGSEEWLVARLRMYLVIGYVMGLTSYAVVVSVGLQALPVAAVIACGTVVCCGWWRPARVPLDPDSRETSSGSAHESRPHRPAFMLSMGVVAVLKALDALRGMYLPLYAASTGVPPALISPMLAISALLELVALPLLGRVSLAWGSATTMVFVSLAAVVSFALMLGGHAYGVLFVAQVVYAITGAGFQSIGLLLLGRTSGGGPGAGASSFMAVTQIGTIIGALLPLAVEGYSAAMFVLALVFAMVATGLSMGLRIGSGRW